MECKLLLRNRLIMLCTKSCHDNMQYHTCGDLSSRVVLHHEFSCVNLLCKIISYSVEMVSTCVCKSPQKESRHSMTPICAYRKTHSIEFCTNRKFKHYIFILFVLKIEFESPDNKLKFSITSMQLGSITVAPLFFLWGCGHQTRQSEL